MEKQHDNNNQQYIIQNRLIQLIQLFHHMNLVYTLFVYHIDSNALMGKVLHLFLEMNLQELNNIHIQPIYYHFPNWILVFHHLFLLDNIWLIKMNIIQFLIKAYLLIHFSNLSHTTIGTIITNRAWSSTMRICINLPFNSIIT